MDLLFQKTNIVRGFYDEFQLEALLLASGDLGGIRRFTRPDENHANSGEHDNQHRPRHPQILA
jgi:hypothetical protein